jgi:uncharacterized protein YdeI (YjbR/CyaY-like superfamily)
LRIKGVVVFYKVHTGRRSIAYSDAIDESLCFGCVDSLVKRLDDSRYALKFTPRKAAVGAAPEPAALDG